MSDDVMPTGQGAIHIIRYLQARVGCVAVCLALIPVADVSRTRIRYFREEMTARNVYVINKLRWDRRALQNVSSALRDYNNTGGRTYDFPENVCAAATVTRITSRWRFAF